VSRTAKAVPSSGFTPSMRLSLQWPTTRPHSVTYRQRASFDLSASPTASPLPPAPACVRPRRKHASQRFPSSPRPANPGARCPLNQTGRRLWQSLDRITCGPARERRAVIPSAHSPVPGPGSPPAPRRPTPPGPSPPPVALASMAGPWPASSRADVVGYLVGGTLRGDTSCAGPPHRPPLDRLCRLGPSLLANPVALLSTDPDPPARLRATSALEPFPWKPFGLRPAPSCRASPAPARHPAKEPGGRWYARTPPASGQTASPVCAVPLDFACRF